MKQFHFDSLDSTQNKAFDLIEKGEHLPFFVTTDMQTAGRGRLDRQWYFEKNKSLAVSIALSVPSEKISGLSLVVGLACLDVLNRDDLRLKWPNDIMMNESKVGGVLIESKIHDRDAVVVVGIGLNLASFEGSEYQSINTSLNVFQLAERVLEKSKLLADYGFSHFQKQYTHFLWGLDREIEFKVGSQKFQGSIQGINASGELILRSGEILRFLESGEISL